MRNEHYQKVKVNEDPRGMITEISPKGRWGVVLAENGLELYFDANALRGVAIRELKKGSFVTFYLLHYGPGYPYIVEHLSLDKELL